MGMGKSVEDEVCESEWIQPALSRDQWLQPVNTVIKCFYSIPCQSVPAPVPALWNKTHQNHKNLWLYTAVVLLMMGANSIRNM
jgi:hypothetical protein